MTCSLQYTFGPTKVQPVTETTKSQSLSTTCKRYTSDKLNKVRYGFGRKKHFTLPSTATVISAPLELMSCRNNEKYAAIEDCFSAHDMNDNTQRQPSLTSLSTATTTDTLFSPGTALVSFIYPEDPSFTDLENIQHCVNYDNDKVDDHINENDIVTTPPTDHLISRYTPEYYTTLQKLLGIPAAEDNSTTKSYTNTAVLISLSTCALAAGNYARHRRQKARKATAYP
ncbi:hypothetical protein BDF20DRAFT_832695 [Mycotypha africana]|uniref:uncharacterized protein n=1 Tax=Mycotypha africana TaxID=64632 RepID=UPI0023015622|nr:uncharacterized protein BDF20DRAFT_832695 [Mycotypha africana]KAI8987792.1 hypothetical protein BDF20DRAFT_832695 [Mycotypha africana]